MNKLFQRTLIAAAAALPALAFSQAVPILFNPDGIVGGLPTISVDLLDWAPGNALSVGGNPAGGLAVTDTQSLLYQANLSITSLLGAAPNYTNCVALCFKAVAGFQEVVTNLSTVVSPTQGPITTVTFGLASDPTLGRTATNYFYIYAGGAGTFGNNLTGQNFTAGTVVLSGYVTALVSGSYAQSGDNLIDAGLPGAGTPNRFDNFGDNNYVGTSTIVGSGATDINVTIDFADANFFPGFTLGNLFFSFFNNSQVTPFNQADPSAAFSSNGIANADQLANIGTINGQPGAVDRNFQLQADANQSFRIVSVPEPGSLALVGLALGALGFASRRASKQK